MGKSLTKASPVKIFSEINLDDLPFVGGKNASLGEMYNELKSKGVNVPNGFATTSNAFWDYLSENRLQKPLKNLLNQLDRGQFSNLGSIGQKARKLILNGKFSSDFSKEVINAYKDLSGNDLSSVAVRSSATAEDLPDASFAGQHDTFLNIKGEEPLLIAIKKCFASLFTDRAIKYREDKGFQHHDIALSVGVQLMVRADKGCSGVGFTIEPESGFENVMLLSGVWGLGENIVQGVVNPDEFYVFKPTLQKGKNPIIQKKLGDKKLTMIYGELKSENPTTNINTPITKQQEFVLSDKEVIKLSKWAFLIEEHYKKAMDIEWAKDGVTNELFIIQARPETVHYSGNKNFIVEYTLLEKGKLLADGNAVGSKIKVGNARLLKSPKDAVDLNFDSIIVTDNITPDWDPLLKQIGGIITNKGGRTSHACRCILRSQIDRFTYNNFEELG